MPDSPLLQAAQAARTAALRSERKAAVNLVNAYGRAWQKLQGDIDALLAAMSELGEPTWAQVERLSLYRQMLTQLETEVSRYATIAENEIDASAKAAVQAALKDSAGMIQAALPGLDAAGVDAALYKLNPDAVSSMIGFLDNGSPLFKNLQRLGPDVAALVADKLREGIILGYNPRKVARIIRDATGQGLTWSLTTARTANLWAYRSASLANYRANSQVVSGWVWWTALDDRCCMGCISQHGSFHTLEETLNGHHSCRCAMLPQTKSYAELGLPGVTEEPPSYETGEAWFKGQPETAQRDLMGPAMFDAWRAGEFAFGDLSVPYTDDTYGEMRRAASLKDLLGERAKTYYAK